MRFGPGVTAGALRYFTVFKRGALSVDRTSAAISALVAVLLLVAIFPLFVVEIPAMLDYVNHLARMELLASGVHNPAYVTHWRLYPNLAMDLIVPLLAHWMSVDAAGRVFIGTSQILVVTGAVAIEVAVKRKHRFGGLGALLVLFSLPFAWGQMNFTFGMGLAAWGIALWILFRHRTPGLRWTVHIAVVLALFVSHFFALGVYGLTIGLLELSAQSERPMSPGQLFRLAVLMAWPVIVLVVVMMLTGGGIGKAKFDWDFGLKVRWFTWFMNVYDHTASVLTTVALVAILLILVLLRRRSAARHVGSCCGGEWQFDNPRAAPRRALACQVPIPLCDRETASRIPSRSAHRNYQRARRCALPYRTRRGARQARALECRPARRVY